MMYNKSMENILSILKSMNVYITGINLGLGLVLLIVLICFLFKIKHSKQQFAITIDNVNDVKLKADASKTKYTIVAKDLKRKTTIFGKVVSSVAVLKYLRKRENRRREKEYKQYEKHRQQLSRIFK